jgi:hypothetical protein
MRMAISILDLIRHPPAYLVRISRANTHLSLHILSQVLRRWPSASPFAFFFFFSLSLSTRHDVRRLTSCHSGHGRHSRSTLYRRRASSEDSSLDRRCTQQRPNLTAFVSCFFFGITSVQLYMYTQRYPNDRPLYKALVGWCWVIDAVQTAFTCHVVYFYTV